MRDFERLEELSSTVRSGLNANGVIWAIDQALAGSELGQGSIRALESGRDILRSGADPTIAPQADTPRRSQNMLGSEGARNVRHVIIVAAELKGEDASEVLTELADALDAVCNGQEAAAYSTQLERALKIFSEISEIKLGQANGIVRTRKKQARWLPRTMTSFSS